mmetsp:Transcript_132223/g.410955  ORF Transcript_132223/g.410955 Transcript_132223/m.410955 type:complete len:355 (+) Transcript_132223:473-1537(+)
MSFRLSLPPWKRVSIRCVKGLNASGSTPKRAAESAMFSSAWVPISVDDSLAACQTSSVAKLWTSSRWTNSARFIALTMPARSCHSNSSMRLLAWTATAEANMLTVPSSEASPSLQSAQHKFAMACGGYQWRSHIALLAVAMRKLRTHSWRVSSIVARAQPMLERPCGLNWPRRLKASFVAAWMNASTSGGDLERREGLLWLPAGPRPPRRAPRPVILATAQMVMDSSCGRKPRKRSAVTSCATAQQKVPATSAWSWSRAQAHKLLAKPCAEKPLRWRWPHISSRQLQAKATTLWPRTPSLPMAHKLLAKHCAVRDGSRFPLSAMMRSTSLSEWHLQRGSTLPSLAKPQSVLDSS